MTHLQLIKPSDPREQDAVEPVLDAGYALPSPGVSEPIYLSALRSELPAETCSVCGEPSAYHFDTSGCLWIGCLGVPARKALKTLQPTATLRDVAVWGDAYPRVTEAVTAALRAGCGQDVGYFFDTLRADEQLHLARRLADLAVTAYLKDQR